MSSYEKFKAKKCRYNGTDFKSNLEGRAAEALDNLDIHWVYEGWVIRGPGYGGGQYTPDFQLPELDAFIEVAGEWDEDHRNDAARLIHELPCYSWKRSWNDLRQGGAWKFVAMDGVGALWAVDGQGRPSQAAYLARCPDCGTHYLAAETASYACPSCGAHHGDAPLLGNNLLVLGGAAYVK